jgi:hypothetical protein
MSAKQVAEVTPLEPVAVEGCGACAVQAESREVAREAGVLEAVAFANAEIRNHPHRAPVRRQLPALEAAG